MADSVSDGDSSAPTLTPNGSPFRVGRSSSRSWYHADTVGVSSLQPPSVVSFLSPGAGASTQPRTPPYAAGSVSAPSRQFGSPTAHGDAGSVSAPSRQFGSPTAHGDAGPGATPRLPGSPRQSSRSPGPLSRTGNMPDPASIERQKEQFRASIEKELEQGVAFLAQQLKHQTDVLIGRAEQVKAQHSFEIDRQVKERQLQMVQRYDESVLMVQQAAQRLTTQLEHQASQLHLEYQHHKNQDVLLQQTYKTQVSNFDALAKLESQIHGEVQAFPPPPEATERHYAATPRTPVQQHRLVAPPQTPQLQPMQLPHFLSGAPTHMEASRPMLVQTQKMEPVQRTRPPLKAEQILLPQPRVQLQPQPQGYSQLPQDMKPIVQPTIQVMPQFQVQPNVQLQSQVPPLVRVTLPWQAQSQQQPQVSLPSRPVPAQQKPITPTPSHVQLPLGSPVAINVGPTTPPAQSRSVTPQKPRWMSPEQHASPAVSLRDRVAQAVSDIVPSVPAPSRLPQSKPAARRVPSAGKEMSDLGFCLETTYAGALSLDGWSRPAAGGG